ncbi:hypothetical protein DXX99_06970 [Ammonifex thiophilus]|uniref:Uncharacterized protein n=1 Tax=Ammonifex thiophilus TaxID=444093 RepID=A0A3D8P2J5_9THEO|nr:hypothetical protein DXX99_06970 [Ammonifex thiophilus]
MVAGSNPARGAKKLDQACVLAQAFLVSGMAQLCFKSFLRLKGSVFSIRIFSAEEGEEAAEVETGPLKW